MTEQGSAAKVCRCPPNQSNGGSSSWCERCERPKGFAGRQSMRPGKRPWAIAVRALAVPVWYPFAVLAWIGERSDSVFWWIEDKLPRPVSRG